MSRRPGPIRTPLAAVLLVVALAAPLAAQVPLPANKIPQFVEALPVLGVSTTNPAPVNYIPLVTSTTPTLSMCEFKTNVLPPGNYGKGTAVGPTSVWGYWEGSTCPGKDTVVSRSYLGPVILATKGVPTEVTYLNQLGSAATTNVLAYKNSVDQTLMWADPLNPTPTGSEENACAEALAGAPPGTLPQVCAALPAYGGPIPAAPHLHGGEVPAELDGGPDAWFTSDANYYGHGYYTKGYKGRYESLEAAQADSSLRPGDVISVSEDALNPDENAAGGHPGTLYRLEGTDWKLFPGATYRYPNSQDAAPIWFHDHTLGATRLNVYAGIAGGYVIKDDALVLPTGLTATGIGTETIVPLVLQDRMFDTNGQLLLPNVGLNPEHPLWVPEFVGDVIVVNGKAWPFHTVQPKRYRFLFINGSNARTYELSLTKQVQGGKGPAIWVIGNDGGYLDKPVATNLLTIMPGERYDVIIDFAGFGGSNLLLTNSAKTPYPAGAPVSATTTGRVMQFRVAKAAVPPTPDTGFDPASGLSLRAPIDRLKAANAQKTRALTLNEFLGAGGPLEILVNNTKYRGDHPARPLGDFTAVSTKWNTSHYSELPYEGETEVWEIINLTADAHPIHPHLVEFQVLNRQAFDLRGYNALYNASFPAIAGAPAGYIPGYGPPLDYAAAANGCDPGVDPPPAGPLPIGCKLGGNPDVTPFLKGAARPALPTESGWKDTVIAYPGEVTRIAIRFAPTDGVAKEYPFDPSFGHGYVWHCHIIDHEDNEMMRPMGILPASTTRTYVKGTDY